MIDHDLPCVGCGYNLRGLSVDARCPECAAAIGPSRDAHRQGAARLLHLGGRRWLLTLGAGTACLFLAAVLPHAPGTGDAGTNTSRPSA